MSANEKQIGGSHYAGEYQHWDWAIDINLPYLESAATKYISRWRDKNGAQDVEKAIHYMEKALETFSSGRHQNTCLFCTGFAADHQIATKLTAKFLSSLGQRPPLEVDILIGIASWKHKTDLHRLLEDMALLHRNAPSFKAPPEAAGAAPRQAGQVWPTTQGMQHPFGYDAQEED